MIDVGCPKFDILRNNTNLAGMQMGFVNSETRLTVQVLDDNGQPHQPPAGVELKLFNQDGGEIETSGPPQYDSNGQYYYYDYTPEFVGTTLFRWKNNDNSDYGLQMLLSIDAKIQYFMFLLKGIIDKSMKDSTKTYGYTDADLFMYIVNGIAYFNVIPPPTAFYISNIPNYLQGIIIDIATLFAVQAQSMYAIDTDVIYNDQGISLTIDHFNKLGSVYNNLYTRVTENAKKIKWTMMRSRALVAYNPQRSRGFMFSQIVTSGFPFMGIYGGVDGSIIFRG